MNVGRTFSTDRHPRERLLLLAVAAAIFAGIFALRVAVEDPNAIVTVLFALPIALVASDLGKRWGLFAAALALGTFALWDLTVAQAGDHSALDYLSRAAAFLVVGGAVGALSDRVRRVSAERARFWDLSSDLLCTVGFDGYYRRLNPAWQSRLGWTPEELRAQPAREFIHPDDRQATGERIMALRAEASEVRSWEYRIKAKDGSYRSLLWSAVSAPDEGRIYAAAKDITERKRSERAIEAAREEAERANRAKSEFLSRMSHELRTPLNAVIGFSQLLETEELEPDQQESAHQILKAGRHLLKLIDEVLDISRIEAGTISISIEPVHLGSALADALSLVRPLADGTQVTLDVDPSELDDVYVQADQQRLKQVLINLLSNAVKYNREGGTVRVSCEGTDDEKVRFAVIDSGRGMSEEQLEGLFSPFERLGAERTGIEGVGLGMALSKRLVETMGGTIRAESEVRAGTTMTVELASAQAPKAEEEWSPEVAMAGADGMLVDGRKVLYVEDNLSNLKLVRQILMKRLPGVKLIPALYGRLGLDLAGQHRPDLILLDLHLPDLDGKEILESLKGDPVTAAIPVVMISADATPGQIERLREAGAADYLTKPIDAQRLLDVVLGTPALT